MTEVLFDQHSRARVRSRVLLDETGRPIMHMQQECAPIIEQNRREANEWQPEYQRNPIAARKIASIPFVVWDQLRACGIISKEGNRVIDERAFLALLSDPDLRGLRCDNGKRLA